MDILNGFISTRIHKNDQSKKMKTCSRRFPDGKNRQKLNIESSKKTQQ